MKSIRLIIITALTITLSSASNAQKVWTLEDCINYAIENNITVKRQELTAESAERTYFQSKMAVLPNVNANGSHFYNSGKAINYETYSYVNESFQGGNLALTTEVDIFNGLQTLNTIKKSKLDFLSQLENVEKAKNDITINVSTAYLQILLNKELRDNAEQQLDITLDQIEKTKKLFEIGNAAKGDLLQIESQAASEKAALTNAENNLKISYLDLSQLLNLEDPENFEILFPEIPDITLADDISEVSSIFNDAIVVLPEIKSAELQLKSFEQNLSISKGAISPTISIGYQYSSRYSELTNNPLGTEIGQATQPTGVTESGENIYNFYSYNTYADSYPSLDQISDNASQAFYIAIRIPIFNNWNTMNSINQAEINLSDSKLNLDLQKQNLYKSIQQARVLAIAAMDRYVANLEAVESMQEAFRYTEQKYQVGLVDILEYKTAKIQLNQTKSDLSQAKYEYIFRTKILEFYKGEQITL
ncbi:MAG: TolC family protein [Bacteroidales bacterium]|nr:TolC family protein [Bacteroidales bacterium]